MVADIEIAQAAKMRPILDVAADLGLGKDDLVLKSDSIAKIRLTAVERARKARQGKFVLVTGTTRPDMERARPSPRLDSGRP